MDNFVVAGRNSELDDGDSLKDKCDVLCSFERPSRPSKGVICIPPILFDPPPSDRPSDEGGLECDLSLKHLISPDVAPPHHGAKVFKLAMELGGHPLTPSGPKGEWVS